MIIETEAHEDPVEPESEGPVEPEPGESPPPADPGVPLGQGLALTIDEANTLAATAGTQLVVPLGPVGAGKTTLIVEMYARYLTHMSWADRTFGGSESLLDFELLAFPSRLQSGADLPATWRTRLQDGDRFLLHLRLDGSEAAPGEVNLLVANLSGELSEGIRDGHDPVTEIPLLPQARRIVLCVDGAKVASDAFRDRALSDTRQILRGLAEADALGTGARLALVATKWDEIAEAGSEARWQEVEEELAGAADSVTHENATFKVAARAKHTVPDDGMEALMRWMTSSDDRKPQTETPREAIRALGRDKREGEGEQ